MKNDAAYFRHRARIERIAAMDAPHPKAREAHLAMAESYEGRLRAIAAERRRSGIQLVSAA